MRAGLKPAFPGDLGLEPGGTLCDPANEFFKSRVRAQCLYRCIGPGQFRFAKRCVDFPVTDVMQKNGWPALAAFELWHQVMKALGDIRRNRAPA